MAENFHHLRLRVHVGVVNTIAGRDKGQTLFIDYRDPGWMSQLSSIRLT
jgi:hypothetical protein